MKKYLSFLFGQLDKAILFSFKEDSQGQTVFFPWGYFGKARIVNATEKQDIFRSIRIYYYSAFSIIILVSIIGGMANFFANSSSAFFTWVSIATALSFIAYSLLIINKVKSLPISNESLTFKENSMKMANTYSSKTLWWYFLLFVGLVCLSAFNLVTDPESIVMSSFGIVLFSIFAVIYAYVLILKRKNQ